MFIINLSCRFIILKYRPVLRQGCLKLKEIEEFTKYFLEITERKTPIFVTRCFLTTNWPKLKDPWTFSIKVAYSRQGPLVLCPVVPSIESYRLNTTIIDYIHIYKWMNKSVFRGLLHFIPFFWAVHKNHKKLLQLLIHVQPNLVMG